MQCERISDSGDDHDEVVLDFKTLDMDEELRLKRFGMNYFTACVKTNFITITITKLSVKASCCLQGHRFFHCRTQFVSGDWGRASLLFRYGSSGIARSDKMDLPRYGCAGHYG